MLIDIRILSFNNFFIGNNLILFNFNNLSIRGKIYIYIFGCDFVLLWRLTVHFSYPTTEPKQIQILTQAIQNFKIAFKIFIAYHHN